ncbi:hypothetical protein [Rhodanobacter caeni]|uniref:Secreted protein n=1 Tax=Rhodanobacter caeni TaxID=657654 RepID=A0ABN0UW95_9GAMM
MTSNAGPAPAHTLRSSTALRWGMALAGCALAAPAGAQLAPRLTGEAVIAQLDSAQRDLAARAQASADPQLAATSGRLARIASDLRAALGGADATRPVDLIDARAQAKARRAQAAAQRTRAYLDIADGCLGGDASAITDALAASVKRLAEAADSSREAQPVIDAVETLDHQPLFAVQPGDKPLAFALVGANLSDAQCADPQIIATDAQGAPLAVQPVITGVSPARIELKLPPSQMLDPGNYVLHVVPRRKTFLLGCTVQPEAVAVVQVARSPQFSVDYTLTAMCAADGGAQKSVPLGAGTLPDIAYGSTVSQQIDTTACGDPLSYALTATVRRGDGSRASVGPIVQSANASITAGLPGGLSLSWNPSVHTMFVRSGANTCKGVH